MAFTVLHLEGIKPMVTLDTFIRDPNLKHLSFLLRVWKDGQGGEWHATLQNVLNGDCYHFASLYELYVNLREITSQIDLQEQDGTFEPFKSIFSDKME